MRKQNVEVGENVDVEDLSAFIGDADEFKKAGLLPEGMYKWEVDSMVRGTTDFDGEKKHVIVGQLRATAVALYSGGDFIGIEEFPVAKRKTQNFKLEGDAQQQLRTLYEAVTGRTPPGTLNEKSGRYELNKLSIAEAVVGGSAWNTIYHFSPDGKNETYAVMGKKFRREPLRKFTVRTSQKAENDGLDE